MAQTGTVTMWIREDEVDADKLADALREVANKIEGGFTSGHYPTFEMVIEEDE